MTEPMTDKRLNYFETVSWDCYSNPREYGELCDEIRRLRKREERLMQWLNVVLDQTDYTRRNRGPTEMVGAVLSVDVIKNAREALIEGGKYD